MSRKIKKRFWMRWLVYSGIVILWTLLHPVICWAIDPTLDEKTFNLISERGIFALLFVLLLWWVLRQNAQREDRLIKHICDEDSEDRLIKHICDDDSEDKN